MKVCRSPYATSQTCTKKVSPAKGGHHWVGWGGQGKGTRWLTQGGKKVGEGRPMSRPGREEGGTSLYNIGCIL